MKLLTDTDDEVRYVRDRLEVIADHYSFGCEVTLQLGLSEPGQDSPSEWFLPQELCPGAPDLAGGFMYHDRAQWPRLLARMAEGLREGCDAVLRGSVQEFEEAAQRQDDESRQSRLCEEHDRAAAIAEEAWRRRDYATVFAAYASISALLTPLESRKLDYASARLEEGIAGDPRVSDGSSLLDHPRTKALANDIIAGRITVLDPDQVDHVVQRIVSGFERAFPRSGAVMYWDNGSDDPGSRLDEFERARSFVSKAFQAHGISAEDAVVVVWDDASDPTLQMPASVLLARLDDILSPPNLYVVPMDVSWCICHTSHGELVFGFSTDCIGDHA